MATLFAVGTEPDPPRIQNMVRYGSWRDDLRVVQTKEAAKMRIAVEKADNGGGG